ncbi:MAG: XRE family transcriptional regulator [Thermocrinis sp.]|jgi:phage repressor protein C with HTH and peptisase S24 domain|uniref:XRE family transcriptional regulator n=1 Tax=Thermocrinis sp. TaxID=2024383 RepID=UPI003C0F47C8
MSDIGKRIRELRETLGLTQKQFGEKIGKSWRTVQDWEAGKSSIPDHTLRFISSTFGVSYEWLKEGKGEMRDRKVLVKELKDKTEETLESFTQIPVVRRSWTGFTMEVAGWGLVSKETILKGGQLAVQVKDDSMEPSLRNGDLVVFKLYTGDGSDIPSGKIVIVRGRNGELLVRRLVRIDAVMMLVSDNPKYPPILPEQIKVEEWRIIGVAVEAVKRIEL